MSCSEGSSASYSEGSGAYTVKAQAHHTVKAQEHHTVKAQACHTVLPKPSLFAHTQYMELEEASDMEPYILHH